MTQPVVDQTMILVFHCRLDTATTIVAADDNMFDLENLNSKLNDRKTIQVGVHHDIGDISMNKHLTRRQIDNLVCRNPAV